MSQTISANNYFVEGQLIAASLPRSSLTLEVYEVVSATSSGYLLKSQAGHLHPVRVEHLEEFVVGEVVTVETGFFFRRTERVWRYGKTKSLMEHTK